MTDMQEKPAADRSCVELLQTAKARFETTEAAALKEGLDLQRISDCGDGLLARIHAGPHQEQVLWVLEIGGAMLTAVLAVNGRSLPVADGIDPASFAMSVLRDLKNTAAERGFDFVALETTAAECLRAAAKEGFGDEEVFWAVNRATAQLELAWARAGASRGE